MELKWEPQGSYGTSVSTLYFTSFGVEIILSYFSRSPLVVTVIREDESVAKNVIVVFVVFI